MKARSSPCARVIRGAAGAIRALGAARDHRLGVRVAGLGGGAQRGDLCAADRERDVVALAQASGGADSRRHPKTSPKRWSIRARCRSGLQAASSRQTHARRAWAARAASDFPAREAAMAHLQPGRNGVEWRAPSRRTATTDSRVAIAAHQAGRGFADRRAARRRRCGQSRDPRSTARGPDRSGPRLEEVRFARTPHRAVPASPRLAHTQATRSGRASTKRPSKTPRDR
jgi:hypothetical protein